MQNDRQRVWVSRHVLVLLQSLFGVVYSVRYSCPEKFCPEA
jgi:hypothetical protein